MNIFVNTLYTIRYVYMPLLCSVSSAVGCIDTVTMTEPSGSFGITQRQYTNHMRCHWNIQVASTDVGWVWRLPNGGKHVILYWSAGVS